MYVKLNTYYPAQAVAYGKSLSTGSYKNYLYILRNEWKLQDISDI